MMMTKSSFLASALAAGAVAQTITVMKLFLNTLELGNITLHGSVISAAPDATTYSITSVGDADCTQDCTDDIPRTGLTDDLQMTFVNGPSTFAHHFIKPDAYTIDYECRISDHTNADCEGTMQGPSAGSGSYQTEALVWASTSLTPVTITAGLEKISAVSTATTGTAQTAASASSIASNTGASASGTSSGSASSASTTASSAAAGAEHNIMLAALCGAFMVILKL